MPTHVALTLRDPLRSVIAEAARRGLVDAVEVVPSGYAQAGLADLLRARLADLGLPYSFHFVDGSLGSADLLENNHFDRTRDFVEGFQPLFVSDHLTAHRAGGLDLECNLPLIATEEAADIYVENLEAWLAAVRPPAPFLLEHVPAYWTHSEDTLSPGALYTQVVERTGVGILLDLHNLYVDERNTGADPMAFLDGLPADRIREVHLAGGHEVEGGGYLDSHDSAIPERVYTLLAAVLERCTPDLIVLEREHAFGDPEALLQEVARVRTLVG